MTLFSEILLSIYDEYVRSRACYANGYVCYVLMMLCYNHYAIDQLRFICLNTKQELSVIWKNVEVKSIYVNMIMDVLILNIYTNRKKPFIFNHIIICFHTTWYYLIILHIESRNHMRHNELQQLSRWLCFFSIYEK